MKALVLGATGLVGNEIVNRLISNDRYTQIVTFGRRKLDTSHPKLTQHVVDFAQPENWKGLVTGDVLYSALGTTLKAAGSKEAQYKIDHDYQLMVAEIASHNNVDTYVLISSVNADPHSKFFYLRMKGELEVHLKKLSFKSVNFLRPGPLEGQRTNPRTSEVLSLKILNGLKFLVPVNMRPIGADFLSRRCLEIAESAPKGINVYNPADLFC